MSPPFSVRALLSRLTLTMLITLSSLFQKVPDQSGMTSVTGLGMTAHAILGYIGHCYFEGARRVDLVERNDKKSFFWGGQCWAEGYAVQASVWLAAM